MSERTSTQSSSRGWRRVVGEQQGFQRAEILKISWREKINAHFAENNS